MKISVIIPVFRGSEALKELCRESAEELNGLADYEIILVYDYGNGERCAEIDALCNEFPGRITALYTGKRMGQHGAIIRGIPASGGDFVITMDDDFQHHPRYIRDMITRQKEGQFDVVYANFTDFKQSRIRSFASSLYRKILVRSVAGLAPFYSPYRLIRRETAIKAFARPKSYHFIDGYLGMADCKFGKVDALHGESRRGGSSYSMFRLIEHGFKILVNYSGRR